MGANTSSLLSEEIEEIAKESNMHPKEIKRLYRRFQKLDRNSSGSIEPEEFMMIPELAMNPLEPRLTKMFHNVNFRQFCINLSVFHANAPKEKKIDFAFRVYDIDEDGFISMDDIRQICQLMVGDNLDETTLNEVCKAIFDDADFDKDGKISHSDFMKTMETRDVANRMNIIF